MSLDTLVKRITAAAIGMFMNACTGDISPNVPVEPIDKDGYSLVNDFDNSNSFDTQNLFDGVYDSQLDIQENI